MPAVITGFDALAGAGARETASSVDHSSVGIDRDSAAFGEQINRQPSTPTTGISYPVLSNTRLSAGTTTPPKISYPSLYDANLLASTTAPTKTQLQHGYDATPLSSRSATPSLDTTPPRTPVTVSPPPLYSPRPVRTSSGTPTSEAPSYSFKTDGSFHSPTSSPGTSRSGTPTSTTGLLNPRQTSWAEAGSHFRQSGAALSNGVKSSFSMARSATMNGVREARTQFSKIPFDRHSVSSKFKEVASNWSKTGLATAKSGAQWAQSKLGHFYTQHAQPQLSRLHNSLTDAGQRLSAAAQPHLNRLQGTLTDLGQRARSQLSQFPRINLRSRPESPVGPQPEMREARDVLPQNGKSLRDIIQEAAAKNGDVRPQTGNVRPQTGDVLPQNGKSLRDIIREAAAKNAAEG
jgi:hypothetical protein